MAHFILIQPEGLRSKAHECPTDFGMTLLPAYLISYVCGRRAVDSGIFKSFKT